MKTKLLFSLLLFSLVHASGWGQFLASYYQEASVCLRNNQSYMYMEANPSLYGTDVYQNNSNVANKYFNQEFKLEPGVTNDFYRLRHAATGKYVTVIVSPGYAEMRNLGDCPNTDYQEFKFIKQAGYEYYYKIQAHFSHNGINEVLCIDDGAGFSNGGIRLKPNQAIGNSDQQKWYLTNLFPPASPSDAVPSLEDRFENSTVGITEQQRFNNLRGVPVGVGASDLYADNTYADFTAQFKLEYTDEVGWYVIRHRTSNKVITINGAYDGRPVELQPYSAPQSQKFKFIFKSNGKYEIHSKYTQGPEVGNNAALLLQMHPTNAGVQMYLGDDKTAGATSNGWQLFQLTRYVNPAQPAEFNSGAAVAGSGKILGKQYHISSRETLALLEPYKVGNDTFVRIQQSPVYGEQSEWIFDPGENNSQGQQTVRIRYGKTGQYLYLPVATQTTNPNLETRLKLTSLTPDERDYRYEFVFFGEGNIDHRFNIFSNVNNTSTNTPNRELRISQDGYLEIGFGQADADFYINLSLPGIGNNTFVIVTKKEGRYMKENGVLSNLVPVIHSQFGDYTSTWQIITLGGGNYAIRNQLSGQFLTSNGSTATGTPVYTIPSATNNQTSWKITRSGNFFNIQNVASGKYLALLAGPADGEPVYQAESFTNGSDWILSRADYAYLSDPALQGVYSPGILEDYFVSSTNALNNNSYLNKMLKNIGLPFEPSLQTTLFGTAEGNQNLADEGFATSGTIPSFLPVVKSALIFTFSYSSARADSAIRNYKIDTAGHRVDVAYALKKYVIENLSARHNSSWTANEAALVAWLERRVKGFRENYANRLEASWEDYKADAQTDILTFSNVFFDDVINTALFQDVEYYPSGINEITSIVEYAQVSKSRTYSNPGALAALTVGPVAATGLGLFLTSVPTIIKSFATAASIRSADAAIAAADLAEGLAVKAAKPLSKTAAKLAGNTLKHVLSLGNTAFIASVAILAAEILVTKALEVAEYVNFENDLYDKIDSCRNTPISIQNITQLPNMGHKIALNQDLDRIFATGERGTLIPGIYTFNGNGNWSNPANWVNGAMPPNPLVEANQDIIINNSGGSCILDIPYRISPFSSNSRIVIKPGKVLQLQNSLTVPSAKIIKPL